MNIHITKANEFKQRYKRLFTGDQAFRLNEISGFSVEEVKAIESKYGISLPESYRVFLLEFGHTPKYLLADFDMTDEYPLEMTKFIYDHLTITEDDYVPPKNVPLNMFVFANYLYEYFYFFTIDNCFDDASIYVSNLVQEGGQSFEFEKVGDSIWDFLDGCLKSYEK
jgi:SMI1 / KNR4 family (SUKH-1)